MRERENTPISLCPFSLFPSYELFFCVSPSPLPLSISLPPSLSPASVSFSLCLSPSLFLSLCLYPSFPPSLSPLPVSFSLCLSLPLSFRLSLSLSPSHQQHTPSFLYLSVLDVQYFNVFCIKTRQHRHPITLSMEGSSCL